MSYNRTMKLYKFIALGLSILIICLISMLYFFRGSIPFLNNENLSHEPLVIKGVGVIGDSQSDEYRADDNRGGDYASTTFNWVEILEKKRGFNFGEWGVYGEPRRTGYAYNWARTGSTTETIILSGQDTGLAEQIKSGKVNVVIIYVGANDFVPYRPNGYREIYNGSLSDEQIQEKVDTALAQIRTTTRVVKQAGADAIIIVTVPDWGRHLAVQVAFPNPIKRARVTDTVNEINKGIELIAGQTGATTLDSTEFFRDLTKDSNGSEVTIGGATFNRILPSNTSWSLFLDDAIHPGTVVNGFFANAIIEHLNSNYGTSIKPLTPLEIFKTAGFR